MRRRIASVALLGAAVLSACGSSGGDSAIPRGTTTSTARRTTSTSSAATTDDEQTITARYEAFWDARFKANEQPVNPDDPALREYATGAQLENVVKETTRNRDSGLAFRKASPSVATHRVRVISSDGHIAKLQDCATNDDVVYRQATGEVVNDSVVTHSVEARMSLVDGEWKLESARLLQEWPGVAGCALAS